MALTVAQCLAGLTWQPSGVADPDLSVIVSAPRLGTAAFAVLLEGLAGFNPPGTEFIITVDGPDSARHRLVRQIQAGDPRFAILALPLGDALQAVAVNAALIRARGHRIAYRTDATAPSGLDAVVHPRQRLEEAGFADPHIALTELWQADFARRLTGGARRFRPVRCWRPVRRCRPPFSDATAA